MEQIASFDVPAYVCYLVVLVVGLLVGMTRVNRLMASSPGRWRFIETWLVFGAYVLVPPLLFWFLDSTNALHDTSIVGALLVSLGYRQILAGEMQGVSPSGQVSKLWSPLENWANQVRDRILTKSKLHSDRFNEIVRAHLAEKPERVEALVELAYQTINDRTPLTQDLVALAAETKPTDLTDEAFARTRTRRKVELYMHALRMANPEDYGFLLVQRRLIGNWNYRWWHGNLRARLTQFAGVFSIFGLIGWGAWSFFQPENLLRHFQWRFVKATVTERDRFRTHEFIARRLAATTNATEIATLLDPLTRWLRFREVDRRLADDVLNLVVDYHHPKRNRVTVPVLIDALRNENPEIRLRIHETLKAVKSLDYSAIAIDASLANWVPSKNESAKAVEDQRQKHLEWWEKAKGP